MSRDETIVECGVFVENANKNGEREWAILEQKVLEMKLPGKRSHVKEKEHECFDGTHRK